MGRPRSLDHAAIEADWFNRSMSRDDVAEKHGTTSKTVMSIWGAAVGIRLPDQNRLQYFAERPEGYAIDGDAEAAFAAEIESADDASTRIPTTDPLLARLRQHHAADTRRCFDAVYQDDRKAEPSAAQLAAMAIQHDSNARKCERMMALGAVTA